MKPKVVLIDGSGYIFRAFYAISGLSTSQGLPTNAVYGFINMLTRVLETQRPQYLAIAFDTAVPTFRKERYALYKANRQAPPDDLVRQIPFILKSVEAFGICQFMKEGFEADDLLGTVAKLAEEQGHCVEIITGDKDLMQLVSRTITLYDTMKDRRMDEGGVKERLGVFPNQVIDYLALVGDSSDNIPGVTGIGAKTASDLLNEFGSLDNIYAQIEKISSEKRRQRLLEEKETAYLSRELATVKCDVSINIELEQLRYREPEPEKLRAFFEELEFDNLLKRFDLKRSKRPAIQYECIRSVDALEKFIGVIRDCKVVGVDTETTSLDPRKAQVVGVSLAVKPGVAAYIPVGHRIPGNPQSLIENQIDAVVVRERLRDVLEDPEIKKIGQNLKYDIQILWSWGIQLQGIYSDTLVASYLLDPEKPHNLDALALRYLNHETIKYSDVTTSGKTRLSFSEVGIEAATAYSGEDADVALQLHERLVGDLARYPSLMRLYEEVEVPLVQVLAQMEFRGVGVDKHRLERMSEDLTVALGSCEESIFRHAGRSFNINSPKQLAGVLFVDLNLPHGKKTKTGFSTDESVLQKLASEHAIARDLLRYRELGKLKSTYVEGLLSQISATTGRIHTHFNQAVTATGRLSSSDPNLQNIPTTDKPQYDVRAAFVAAPGFRLLSADYSQIELRLLAHMSHDEELVSAFECNEDVHERTARLIFGVDEVSAEQRKIAKTINFGVMYGQTPFGLSQTLGISAGEAKEFITRYFHRYRGVRNFFDGLIVSVRQCGFAESLAGRRRFIPGLNSQNRMHREMAERTAINTPIQGSAADLIKKAMVALERRFVTEKLPVKMILQVHDELVFEVDENYCEHLEKIVRHEMENAMSLDVALKVDMGWGKSWRECG